MKISATFDPTLLERAREFDQQALTELYDLYSPGLYRFAFHLVGDATIAEECVAETFSRFLQVLKKGKGPRDYPKAYLYRVAHNWMTDWFAHAIPCVELEDDVLAEDALDVDTEEELDEHVRIDKLRKALWRLTPDQRQVILLKYVEDWDNEAIAKALHKPVGSIKSLQHRALASLQRFLKEEK